MGQIVSALIAVVFTALLRAPLRKSPVLLYVIATLVAGVAVYLTYHPLPSQLVRSMVFCVQKGYVGFGFMAIVMFVGVFADDSAIRRALAPVRAEFSIVGGILVIGHVVPYAGSYTRMFASLASLRMSVLVSLVIAMVTLALLVVLLVTSFRSVKRRMDARTWKRVQMLAYPFFILAYFHILGYMIVPVRGGSVDAAIALAYYTVAMIAYVALRLRKASADARVLRGDEA